MEVQLVSHADGRQYLRTGECDGCQRPDVVTAQCCRFIALPLARGLTEDEAHWVSLHEGLSVKENMIVFDSVCSALDDQGTCTLYNMPERPALCERYPEQPQQLLVGCNYEMMEV